MESIYANIVDQDNNYHTEDIPVQNDDFDLVIKQAKEMIMPVCIRWNRPSDGQVAYWSPRGASLQPYWYNL